MISGSTPPTLIAVTDTLRGVNLIWKLILRHCEALLSIFEPDSNHIEEYYLLKLRADSTNMNIFKEYPIISLANRAR